MDMHNTYDEMIFTKRVPGGLYGVILYRNVNVHMTKEYEKGLQVEWPGGFMKDPDTLRAINISAHVESFFVQTVGTTADEALASARAVFAEHDRLAAERVEATQARVLAEQHEDNDDDDGSDEYYPECYDYYDDMDEDDEKPTTKQS